MALIGENGQGKSSVLQAIALTLAPRAAARKYLESPQRFVRDGADAAEISIEFAHRAGARTLTISRSGFESGGEAAATTALVAYGATRLPSPRTPTDVPRIGDSTAWIDSLFDPTAQLTPVTRWVATQRGKPTFRAAARALSAMVFRAPGDLYIDQRREVMLSLPGGAIEVDKLSDGYRALLTLGGDVVRYHVERFGSVTAASGIVLIDEIDAHLHPRWQMRVVAALREAFPRLQFIVTTHAPLCLRGLHEHEVAVMTRDEDGKIFARTGDLEAVESLDASELLTSEAFGLHSTISWQLDQASRDYQRLLAQSSKETAPPLTDDEQTLLETSRGQLARARQLGTTARERLALQLVDRYLGEASVTPGLADRQRLRIDLETHLRDVWQAQVDRAEMPTFDASDREGS